MWNFACIWKCQNDPLLSCVLTCFDRFLTQILIYLNLQVSLWISNQPNIHSIFAYPLHRAQIKFSVKWSLGWVQNLRFCPIYRPLSLGSKMLLIILKCAEKWTRFCWVNWIAQKCRKPQFWGKNSQPISMRSWQYEFAPLALSGLGGSRLTGQQKSAVDSMVD